MDHVEVTTSLDLDSVRMLLTRTLEERGFGVEWEEEWSGVARKGLFTRLSFTVFAVRPGLTVVQLHANSTGWYYFGGLWAGLWSDARTDRVGDVLTEVFTTWETEPL